MSVLFYGCTQYGVGANISIQKAQERRRLRHASVIKSINKTQYI